MYLARIPLHITPLHMQIQNPSSLPKHLRTHLTPCVFYLHQVGIVTGVFQSIFSHHPVIAVVPRRQRPSLLLADCSSPKYRSKKMT